MKKMNNMKQKQKAKPKKLSNGWKLAIGLGLVGFTILIFIIFKLIQPAVTTNHPTSAELMRQGKVTSTLKQASYSMNVIFYDEKSTPDIAKANFDTSDYPKIDLLLYSDGCNRCNQERKQLRDKVKQLDKQNDLVVLINSDQNIQPLKKYFEIPKEYQYPTLLTYYKDNDGEMILENQRIL